MRKKGDWIGANIGLFNIAMNIAIAYNLWDNPFYNWVFKGFNIIGFLVGLLMFVVFVPIGEQE